MIEDQEFYWKLLDTLQDGVYFANLDRKVTYWNKGAEQITGYKSAEILGKHCADNILIHIDKNGNNLCAGACPLSKVIKSGEPFEENIYLHHKKGHRVPVYVRVNPVKNKEGKVVGAIEIFSDSSFKEIVDQRMKELEKLNLIDSRTGLPNRRFLEMTMHTKLSELSRYKWSFGIIYIHIAPRAGKETSTKTEKFAEVLKIVSKTFRNTCNPFDIIGRWEKGEFVGIFGNVDKKKLKSLEKFYRVILEKTDLSAAGLAPSVKIGTAMAQPDDKPESIIDKAKQNVQPGG